MRSTKLTVIDVKRFHAYLNIFDATPLGLKVGTSSNLRLPFQYLISQSIVRASDLQAAIPPVQSAKNHGFTPLLREYRMGLLFEKAAIDTLESSPRQKTAFHLYALIRTSIDASMDHTPQTSSDGIRPLCATRSSEERAAWLLSAN